MKLKRFTHAQLATMHDAGAWDELNEQALRHAPFAIRELKKRGALFGESLTSDLLQEAVLAALEAVRTWQPLNCVFSTHVETVVRSTVLDKLLGGLTGGIGSRRTVVAGRGAEHTSLNIEVEGDREPDEIPTLQDALAYANTDAVPAGFGPPEIELQREFTMHAVDTLMAELSSDESALMRAVYYEDQTFRDYAKIVAKHPATLHRRAQQILETLRQKSKKCVKYNTGCADWKGLRQHYPAIEQHERFWVGTSSVIEGNPIWAEKTGIVWKDWSWKPQPQDLPGKARRALFGREKAK